MSTLNIGVKKLINKLKKLFAISSGFTLIELLVVIGILGVLAAALVATIDPFEQLKKADDAKIKNISVEFQTALVRYYTTHGSFPWNDVASTNTNCTNLVTTGITGLRLNTSGLMACLGTAALTGSLISEGELKASFTSNTTDLGKVSVTWATGFPTDVTVCFSPTSKSQKAAPDAKWNSQGVLQAGCPNAAAAADVCFWCTK